mmetsp:Transcript_8348/g.16533  ORF Transcript_8348/g.16533 Transcript_8348/m.16533 type:complete len:455 (+) Transcript_8348:3435-4799(+)
MLGLLLTLASANPVEYATVFGDVSRYGYYFVDLWVGTPPKKQTVIVDTGSRLTAFPCTGCKECGIHLDTYFDYHSSNTSRVIGCDGDQFCHSCENHFCTYLQSYAEGSSIAGILVEDVMMFGDSLNPDFQTRVTFGCHNRETNLFKTQEADGIMGLAHADRSGKSIIDSMYEAGEIVDDLFSICFANRGGFMTLGGYNTTAHLEPAKWIDMQDGNFYAIHFKEVYVGSTRVPTVESDFGHSYGTGTIVDSGTTFVYLSTPVYEKMWRALEEYCLEDSHCRGDRRAVSYEPKQCFWLDPQEFNSTSPFFDTFPVISLDLGGELMNWQPEHYLFDWPEFPGYFCLGIYDNGRSGSVLGGLSMRGHDFIFDRNKDRIGFAPSLCDLDALNVTKPIRKEADEEPSKDMSTDKKQLFLLAGAVLSALLSISLIVIACYWKRSRKYVTLKPAEVEVTSRV